MAREMSQPPLVLNKFIYRDGTTHIEPVRGWTRPPARLFLYRVNGRTQPEVTTFQVEATDGVCGLRNAIDDIITYTYRETASKEKPAAVEAAGAPGKPEWGEYGP